MSRLDEIAERCEKATGGTVSDRLDEIRKLALALASAAPDSKRKVNIARIIVDELSYLIGRLDAAERCIGGTDAFNKAVREADYETAKAEREAALKAWLETEGEAR